MQLERRFLNPIFLAEFTERLDSANFIKYHANDAAVFENKQEGIWPFAVELLEAQQTKGLWLEFGVLEGKSINWFSPFARTNSVDGKVYGFDSFEGLSEHYSIGNSYSSRQSLGGQAPKVKDNVKLIQGWVESTLDEFLRSDLRKVSFAHLDFGTYSATHTVLSKLKNRFTEDALILFDEFHGFTGWQLFEHKALYEVFSSDEFKFVAFARRQALIQLKKRRELR